MLSATEAAKLDVICRVAFDGICVHEHGKLVEANDSFAAMTGYSVEEIIGMPVAFLTPVEERANVASHIESGDSSRYESVLLRKDGTTFPVEICGASLPGGQRAVALRDISKRRESQDALLASEDRYRDLVEHTQDLVGTHDLEGRILSANPAFAKAFSKPDNDIHTLNLREELIEGRAFVDYLGLLQQEGSASGTISVLTSDGRRRQWEYHNTLRTDGTAPPIVRVVARDVTEREETLTAVRRSEEHFRSIIENASDLIAIIQPDGVISYESPSIERVLGISADSVVGTRFVDLVHPDSVERASEFLNRQRAEPEANATAELQFRHHNGSWRSFEVVARNLTAGGVVTAIVIGARDITERKMLEAQLAQANRLSSLGRLAATVAHEFNNVLMGIQPFTELMQRPNATPAIIKKGAGHISNSIQRGKRIALDILRFTQPAQPVTSIVDVGEWWEKFAPEAESLLGNVVSLVPKIPHRGTCIVADRQQLSQVMANLVANARDAMPSGGTLTIEASEPAADAVFTFGIVTNPERLVHISVSDTGHGMNREVLEHVFEPLFTTKKSGGTGLGLAVAHQVLAQHGGFIFAESEVGHGTSFHLFFTRGAAPYEENSENAVQPPNLAGRTLLMIEDEELIVEGVSALLRDEGMKVVAIGTGLEAAAAVALCHPDVVLLDFGLPDMDGFQVYEVLRELDPGLPVIFATGHGDRRSLHDAMVDPRTRFLQKPFKMEALLEMIAELQAIGPAP